MKRISLLALLTVGFFSSNAVAQSTTGTLSTHGKEESTNVVVKTEVKHEVPQFGNSDKASSSTEVPAAKETTSEMKAASGIRPKED